MLERATLLLVGLALVPVQAAGQAPPSAPAAQAPAPAPQPAGRAYRLKEPVPLRFSVATNVGPVEGTVVVTDVVGRGLEGWGRFELSLRVDPTTVRTGDPLRDRVITEQVLQAAKGPVLVTASTRLSPPRAPATGETAGAEVSTLPAAVGSLDERRGRRPVELRYAWEGSADGGVLRIEHSATLDELGLAHAPHPFVQLSGPIRLRLEAPLVRER